MASSCEDLVTEVTITIDEGVYTDNSQLKDILRGLRLTPGKTSSSYKISGPFQDIEELFMKLCTMKNPHSRHGHSSDSPRATAVARPVMEYIQKRHCEELNSVQGDQVLIEERPGAETDHMTLIFKPRHRGVTAACVQLVRERFVTFYQRVASNLHVENVTVNSDQCKGWQEAFPQLVVDPQPFGAKVTGPYADFASLHDLIQGSRDEEQTRRIHKAHNNQFRSSLTAACGQSDEEEICAICFETMSKAVRKTLGCKHSFCRDCLAKAFDHKPACPICGALYGTVRGNQPEGGTMEFSHQTNSLPGYENVGTIIVHYYIPSGIQKAEHPHPGQRYEGASRTAYLPDSSEGRRVQGLLKRAFQLRLIFTVGKSSTSGRDNVVTWNDIHHKTSICGGPTRYGYPDPDYLSRVQEELKLKGVE